MIQSIPCRAYTIDPRMLTIIVLDGPDLVPRSISFGAGNPSMLKVRSI